MRSIIRARWIPIFCLYAKKIEADPRQPSVIQTVRNVGYRFNVDRLVTDAALQEPALGQVRPMAAATATPVPGSGSV